MTQTSVAVLGFGEAGTAISADLIAAGAVVRGYDPVARVTYSVVDYAAEAEAVLGADVVLSVNSADDAMIALRNGCRGLAPGAVGADLNTGGAVLKRELAAALFARQHPRSLPTLRSCPLPQVAACTLPCWSAVRVRHGTPS